MYGCSGITVGVFASVRILFKMEGLQIDRYLWAFSDVSKTVNV